MSPPSNLTAVADDETIVRFIHPTHFGAAVPPSPNPSISTAAIKSAIFPSGPSVWVLGKLANGLATLEQHKPALAQQGVVAVKAGVLRQMGIDVVYTPNDAKAPLDVCRDAHASLFSLDAAKRDKLVAMFSELIVRLPTGTP